jgi:hypothetical protein
MTYLYDSYMENEIHGEHSEHLTSHRSNYLMLPRHPVIDPHRVPRVKRRLLAGGKNRETNFRALERIGMNAVLKTVVGEGERADLA